MPGERCGEARGAVDRGAVDRGAVEWIAAQRGFGVWNRRERGPLFWGVYIFPLGTRLSTP